jgi:anti-sigma B factor antagonist
LSLLDVATEKGEDAVTIVLRGELDISTAPRVDEELRQVEADKPDRIVVDLRGLEFMDSTGLREQGRRLGLVRGPEAVQRIFNVTRLDERLEIADDPDALSRAG